MSSQFQVLITFSPEAIESVFILYRITGDETLLEHAWRMFKSIENATRTNIASSGIFDVRVDHAGAISYTDSMESFWLAETLKYFYLIFSDPTEVSLDDYVL
jgi:mannosyl-oligosaccharide alpha-1,2-mannosidase